MEKTCEKSTLVSIRMLLLLFTAHGKKIHTILNFNISFGIYVWRIFRAWIFSITNSKTERTKWINGILNSNQIAAMNGLKMNILKEIDESTNHFQSFFLFFHSLRRILFWKESHSVFQVFRNFQCGWYIECRSNGSNYYANELSCFFLLNSLCLWFDFFFKIANWSLKINENAPNSLLFTFLKKVFFFIKNFFFPYKKVCKYHASADS